MILTPQLLIWEAMGKPVPKWKVDAVTGRCATCGQPITEGVSRKAIESDTYSQQADYMKYGDYNCRACAWLNSDPKNNHRNVIVAGSQIWWPMISRESATPDRPQWLDVLKLIAELPPDTPVTGCITTDPKPRLWPRYKLATVGNFGLYVHAPDYDQSGYVQFNLSRLLEISNIISEVMNQKYSKRSIYLGLLADFKTASKDPDEAIRQERRLKELRKTNEFIPALLVTQKISGGKNESGNTGTTGNPEPSRAAGCGDPQNIYRLL